MKFVWVQVEPKWVPRSKIPVKDYITCNDYICGSGSPLASDQLEIGTATYSPGRQGWLWSLQVLAPSIFCVGATSWLAVAWGSPIHTKPRLYITLRDLLLSEWAVLFLSLLLSLLPWLFFSFQLGLGPSHINLWYFVQWLVEFSTLTRVVTVYIGVLLCCGACFFFPQVHCHFIMAINNLKDGETLLKNVQEILPSFSYSGLCLSLSLWYIH